MYFNNVTVPGGPEYQSPGENAVRALLQATRIDWGTIITQIAIIIAFGACAYFVVEGIGQHPIAKMILLVAGFSIITTLATGLLG